jgi:hypothetical protein
MDPVADGEFGRSEQLLVAFADEQAGDAKRFLLLFPG